MQAFNNTCCVCGLSDDCYETYDFHHINPTEKEFSIGSARTNHTKREIANEAKKCCMVCAICHRKLTSGRFDIKDYSVIPFNEALFFNFFINNKKKMPSREFLQKQHSKKISRNQLKSYIRIHSFLECGRLCGVSDNAIRKWCKSYNLPDKKSIINTISDEEWEKI